MNCILFFESGQEPVFLFHVFCLSCTLQKMLQKMWTGGQASKILNILIATLFISFFKCALWTRSCLSISFFSFYLVTFSFYSKSVDRGTSSDNSGELIVIVCVSLFKSVDKMLFVLFYFPSTLYPLNGFFAQSVDRWTSYDNSENFNGIHMYFII